MADIQFKRGLAAGLPTGASGEPLWTTDTHILYIGDGAANHAQTPQARTISTTAPLAGGGDLSANRTISIPAATATANGYLSSTDWATFNGKQDLLAAATATANGYLSSTDWSTFNAKAPTASPTFTTVVNVTAGTTTGLVITSAQGPTIKLNDTRSDAANRNWAFTVTYAAYGVMEMRLSNAQGGDPIAAGATLMSFGSTKVRINNGDFTGTEAFRITGSGHNAQMVIKDTTNTSQITMSASTATSAKPYMGTTTNHPFYFVTNNAYCFGAAASGGFSIGSTLYSTDAGVNNLLVEGTVKSADVQPRTNDTYYLGKNSITTPLAWKGLILKDTAQNKYFRIEVTSGTLVATEIT